MSAEAIRPTHVRYEHLLALERALIEGRSPTAAVTACSKSLGITLRTAWRDYKVVKKRWAKSAEKLRSQPMVGLGMALLKRDELYRASMASGDTRTALAVEQDRCKLLNLYPDEKIVVGRERDDRPVEELTDAELMERIRAADRVLEADLKRSQILKDVPEPQPGKADKPTVADAPTVIPCD